MKRFYFILIFVFPVLISASNLYKREKTIIQQGRKSSTSDRIISNPAGKGAALEIEFIKGSAHNHPSFAIWAEDTSGNYLQTLFVTKSIGTGIFKYGDKESGSWKEGEVRRAASLPYWAHKRGIQASDGLYIPKSDSPVPDAYTGATPKNDFILTTRLDEPGPDVFNVLFEINQPWDWNEYWTNNRFPGNLDYQASAQPALVYSVTIRLNATEATFLPEIIGHSNYDGSDGSLTTNLSNISTALEIAESIVVRVKE
jgi:hypothetical protein